jgi:hypothetical protein
MQLVSSTSIAPSVDAPAPDCRVQLENFEQTAAREKDEDLTRDVQLRRRSDEMLA